MPSFTDEIISSGLLVAVHHVGVGHARHRDVGVGLPAAVAGRLHAHQPGILPVLHVTGQDTVLDQGGSGPRRAFIVDGQRAAAIRDRSVIDHGHAR
jgi:hypothetical protein